jgi:hypothetical protein
LCFEYHKDDSRIEKKDEPAVGELKVQRPPIDMMKWNASGEPHRVTRTSSSNQALEVSEVKTVVTD